MSATMKCLLSVLILLYTSGTYCQTDEIYRLTFSDTSNFRITAFLNHKRPKKILIIDTTCAWSTKRFWLDGVNFNSAQTLKELERDEHHPYHHTYLFKDTLLNKLIDDREKILLSRQSELLRSKKISLAGNNFSTIPSSKKLKGFYVVTTEPVFTSDGKYAFIDLTIFRKNRLKDKIGGTYSNYFGTTCVVYQRKRDNTWEKIKIKNHLLL